MGGRSCAAAFAAAGLLLLALGVAALAQTGEASPVPPPAEPSGTAGEAANSGATAGEAADAAGDLDEQRQQSAAELETLRQEISISRSRRDELDREIAALEADRESINRNLIDTSARSRALETRIGRAAGRLEELRGEESVLRESLEARRSVLIEVIAALQRMGLNPPPALLVRPEDALASVRSAMLLGAVVPEIRAETSILITQLEDLTRVRTQISANREALTADLERLAEEEERLTLLLDEKKRLSGIARAEQARQSALAAELAGKASNLENLIGRLESEIEAVREAAQAARRAEEEQREREARRIAEAREEVTRPDFSDMARIAPAMPFEQARGLLPRPVAGVELAGYDQQTASGEISQGLSIATRAGSRVVSPSDGWVIYAGPFRSYGQLLIINAGSGYHVVLAGMERIDAALGQFVLAGEPVGAMGARRIASTAGVDVGSLRPVLYIEFRKDGSAIDPGPWWSEEASQTSL